MASSIGLPRFPLSLTLTDSLKKYSTVAHASSIGTPNVLSLVHFSLLSVYSPNSVIHPMSSPVTDMLLTPSIYISSPNFLQSLGLYFYHSLNISLAMSAGIQLISSTKCGCPEFQSW